jgi:hypothetical protein
MRDLDPRIHAVVPVTKRDKDGRGIDFEAMEAAFRRAAWKAVHGTREERSGRFLRMTQRDIARVERAMKLSAAKQRTNDG